MCLGVLIGMRGGELKSCSRLSAGDGWGLTVDGWPSVLVRRTVPIVNSEVGPDDGGSGVDADGLRRTVRRQVVTRRPVDERERVSRSRFLELFDDLAEPFSETADPVHVTGSAIVIGPRGVLLHRHRRLGIWLQPGGHIDIGETPWDAALREASEETGLGVRLLAIDLVHLDVHPGPRGHTHLDLRYLVDGGEADPSPPEGESQEIGWFAWSDAIDLADDGLRGALLALRPVEGG